MNKGTGLNICPNLIRMLKMNQGTIVPLIHFKKKILEYFVNFVA